MEVMMTLYRHEVRIGDAKQRLLRLAEPDAIATGDPVYPLMDRYEALSRGAPPRDCFDVTEADWITTCSHGLGIPFEERRSLRVLQPLPLNAISFSTLFRPIVPIARVSPARIRRDEGATFFVLALVGYAARRLNVKRQILETGMRKTGLLEAYHRFYSALILSVTRGDMERSPALTHMARALLSGIVLGCDSRYRLIYFLNLS